MTRMVLADSSGSNPYAAQKAARVGERRVAREELVRDAERIEPFGQCVLRWILSHSPKNTDRAVRAGAVLPRLPCA